MTLEEVKNQIGISSLRLNTAMDAENKPTEWMRHWDNETRTAVSIHKELVGELKADNHINTLGLQLEDRTGEQGPYKAYRIIRYSPSEETL